MARLGSAPATAGEAHPPGVLDDDAGRSAAPRSRRRRRRRAAVADGGERRRRRRVAAADARRAGGDAVLAQPDRLALGPRRRGSRADRARVCAGALAQSRAGAGIDRRAPAGESGGRYDPARTVHGRRSRHCRPPRSVWRAPRPRPDHPGDTAVFPCRRRQPCRRLRSRPGRIRWSRSCVRCSRFPRTPGSAARRSPQSPCPYPKSRSRRSTWRLSRRRQSPTCPPNPSLQENRDAPFVPASRLLARGTRSAVDTAISGAAHGAADLHPRAGVRASAHVAPTGAVESERAYRRHHLAEGRRQAARQDAVDGRRRRQGDQGTRRHRGSRGKGVRTGHRRYPRRSSTAPSASTSTRRRRSSTPRTSCCAEAELLDRLQGRRADSRSSRVSGRARTRSAGSSSTAASRWW